ncbi:MarR family transcriptional regulator [Georgenia sp. SUBG003]|uniref:MarR family winged helix-turn-helix transcriptional regulator n=1 Tax=Georgenia sp. SUBG003 TaxID=1497974 RepID=UPI003AB7CBAB
MVLSALSEAPDRTIRMSRLATMANMSMSRLSHLVDRLSSQGWVERRPDPEDGRSTMAVLTDAGWEKVVETAIIRTFLDGADLSGKTIHPFVTYALGGGRVFADYAELYRGDGRRRLAVQGEEATDAGKVVTQWLTESGLAGR